MLFVLLDEPGVFVFGSAAAAELEIEPIDAELELRAAFDESGIPYAVRWVRPNRRSSLLGIGSIEQGEYRLVPSGPPQPAALIALLEEHPNGVAMAEAGLDTAALFARLRWIADVLEQEQPVLDNDEHAAISDRAPSVQPGEDPTASAAGPREALRLGGPPDRSVVTVAIYGRDLDPEELTRRIGVMPTESHRRGDVFGKRKIPHRIGAWMMTAERTAPASVQECLEELLDRVPTTDALWTELAKDYEIQLRVSVFFAAFNRGFAVSPSVLSMLAAFKGAFMLDIYAG